jgi:hypothetical protein
MRHFLILFVLFSLSVPGLCQSENLPFPVSFDEQAAAIGEASDDFAILEGPIASSAQLSVKDVEGQIIVNIFPSDENGKTQNGQQPYILLFDASSTKSISENMQGKTVEPGWYLANVVGGGKTSRVVFQVK